MGRTGPRLKVIRRLGTPLPGLTQKSADRKQYPPGEHGPGRRRRRKTEYRERLEEKQKVRFNYGLKEKQLRKYFERAQQRPGPTGETLLELLERRLDSVVFRLGFARTIPAARQLVTHGHIRVNDRKVDRPSFEVGSGDEISVAEKMRDNAHIQESVEHGPQVRLPSNLKLDPDDPYVGRVVGSPEREDVPVLVEESSIVEFYAR
jgi:small subunit ribosomal protein S4